MQPTQIDPVSLRSVEDVDNAPFLIESDGTNGLTLYFENEANRQRYLGLSAVEITSVNQQAPDQRSVNRMTGT